MVLLVPPLRFSVAAANPSTLPPASSTSTLYRGAYPRQRHLPFLSRLKLKSILSLTPKPLDETIADWANHHSIKIIHIRCEKPKEEAGGLTRESAAKALMVSTMWNHGEMEQVKEWKVTQRERERESSKVDR